MCIVNNCNNKDKYGEYCYKHRREYLVKENRIIVERWTNKCSDYLKKDILFTLDSFNISYETPIPNIMSTLKTELATEAAAKVQVKL